MKKYIWRREGSLGDILMTLNLVKTFRTKVGPSAYLIYKCHPDMVHIVGTTILRAGFDEVVTENPKFLRDFEEIGLRGYPDNEDYPKKPMKKHLIEYFAEHLGVQPAFDDFELPLPKFNYDGPPFITIHVKAGWSIYKEWPLENWEILVKQLREKNVDVIQIGGPGDPGVKGVSGHVKTTAGDPYDQQRAQFETSLAAIAHAKVHVGLDTWSNHATNIKWNGRQKTQGVIIWGSSQETATGYTKNINIFTKDMPCRPCFKENPWISDNPKGICENPLGQTYDFPKHKCMNDVKVQTVFDSVMKLWNTSTKN